MEKNDIGGTLDMSETVDLIASGYEWICPKCEHFNTEIEITTQVKCNQCERVFLTNPAEHCFG